MATINGDNLDPATAKELYDWWMSLSVKPLSDAAFGHLLLTLRDTSDPGNYGRDVVMALLINLREHVLWKAQVRENVQEMFEQMQALRTKVGMRR